MKVMFGEDENHGYHDKNKERISEIRPGISRESDDDRNGSTVLYA